MTVGKGKWLGCATALRLHDCLSVGCFFGTEPLGQPYLWEPVGQPHLWDNLSHPPCGRHFRRHSQQSTQGHSFFATNRSVEPCPHPSSLWRTANRTVRFSRLEMPQSQVLCQVHRRAGTVCPNGPARDHPAPSTSAAAFLGLRQPSCFPIIRTPRRPSSAKAIRLPAPDAPPSAIDRHPHSCADDAPQPVKIRFRNPRHRPGPAGPHSLSHAMVNKPAPRRAYAQPAAPRAAPPAALRSAEFPQRNPSVLNPLRHKPGNRRAA